MSTARRSLYTPTQQSGGMVAASGVNTGFWPADFYESFSGDHAPTELQMFFYMTTLGPCTLFNSYGPGGEAVTPGTKFEIVDAGGGLYNIDATVRNLAGFSASLSLASDIQLFPNLWYHAGVRIYYIIPTITLAMINLGSMGVGVNDEPPALERTDFPYTENLWAQGTNSAVVQVAGKTGPYQFRCLNLSGRDRWREEHGVVLGQDLIGGLGSVQVFNTYRTFSETNADLDSFLDPESRDDITHMWRLNELVTTADQFKDISNSNGVWTSLGPGVQSYVNEHVYKGTGDTYTESAQELIQVREFKTHDANPNLNLVRSDGDLPAASESVVAAVTYALSVSDSVEGFECTTHTYTNPSFNAFDSGFDSGFEDTKDQDAYVCEFVSDMEGIKVAVTYDLDGDSAEAIEAAESVTVKRIFTDSSGPIWNTLVAAFSPEWWFKMDETSASNADNTGYWDVLGDGTYTGHTLQQAAIVTGSTYSVLFTDPGYITIGDATAWSPGNGQSECTFLMWVNLSAGDLGTERQLYLRPGSLQLKFTTDDRLRLIAKSFGEFVTVSSGPGRVTAGDHMVGFRVSQTSGLTIFWDGIPVGSADGNELGPEVEFDDLNSSTLMGFLGTGAATFDFRVDEIVMARKAATDAEMNLFYVSGSADTVAGGIGTSDSVEIAESVTATKTIDNQELAESCEIAETPAYLYNPVNGVQGDTVEASEELRYGMYVAATGCFNIRVVNDG